MVDAEVSQVAEVVEVRGSRRRGIVGQLASLLHFISRTTTIS
jgi:hypothetical protein